VTLSGLNPTTSNDLTITQNDGMTTIEGSTIGISSVNKNTPINGGSIPTITTLKNNSKNLNISTDKFTTNKDEINTSTESTNNKTHATVESVVTFKTDMVRIGNDTGCTMTGCVIPLVLAISLLLGTLFLCLVILGSTRWRKRSRKYKVTRSTRTKTDSYKTQTVLPVVKEISDEECSL